MPNSSNSDLDSALAFRILGDPGTVSRGETKLARQNSEGQSLRESLRVYRGLVRFAPSNCPWVSEDWFSRSSFEVVVLLVNILLFSMSIFFRRSYFEVFWYNHHMFVIFYIGLVLHGIQ